MQIGPYRVLRVLARGGMGEVCLASLERAGGFRKLVALKRALPEFAADPRFTQMFQREARLAAALNHRNIVQVFDFDHHADQAWIAMEYVRGVDLKAVLDAERLPPGLAITIGLAVARGLDYVHRASDANGEPLNLVHQDVSPANVLLSFEGDIKLSDFGVAWQRDATARGIQGKLAYLSPEAVKGVPVDARSDQFALGVVLYEMLSGRRAFWGEDGAEAILDRVRRAEPVQPLADESALSPALIAVVERAMAPEPADRFPDVAALAEALEAAAAGVDRSVALGGWLAQRFSEPDGGPSAPPVEVTAAAAAPIAVPEGTLAAVEPIASAVTAEPASTGWPLGMIVGLLVLGGAAAFALWPQDAVPLRPDVGLPDAAVDALIQDARVLDAAPPIQDAALPKDATPLDAALPQDAALPRDAALPQDAAPATRVPKRVRAPKTRPRRAAPRSAASTAPIAAPKTVAPATQAPATTAAPPPPSGPRIRLLSTGARVQGAEALGQGWHRVAAKGVLLRQSGDGPTIIVRLRPQGGRFVATVNSKPFGPLVVDGRALGSTPAAAVPLAPGRHVLSVGGDGAKSALRLEVR